MSGECEDCGESAIECDCNRCKASALSGICIMQDIFESQMIDRLDNIAGDIESISTRLTLIESAIEKLNNVDDICGTSPLDNSPIT